MTSWVVKHLEAERDALRKLLEIAETEREEAWDAAHDAEARIERLEGALRDAQKELGWQSIADLLASTPQPSEGEE